MNVHITALDTYTFVFQFIIYLHLQRLRTEVEEIMTEQIIHEKTAKVSKLILKRCNRR